MRAIAITLAITGTALAAVDDGRSVTARDEAKRDADPPALLDFESGLDVRPESFELDGTQIDLSPRTSVQMLSAWRAVPEHEQRDYDRVRWWKTGAQLSYDLGWARVDLQAMYEHHENELGAGNAIDLGASITHERKLSANVTGFVSLGINRRSWLGRPLPGEFNAMQVMLSIGVRWK
jgi:hypothetical protein